MATNRIGSLACGAADARAAARAAGFGLHNAWVCASMYSTQSLFDATFVIPGLGGGSVAFLYLISILAFSLTAFTAAVIDQRLARFARARGPMAAAAAVACAGTLVAFAPSGTDATVAFDCCSGALTGIGSAILLLYWGTAFARASTTTIAIAGAAAVAGGFALNTLVLQALPFPLGGIITAALPLGEVVLLNSVTPRTMADERRPFNSLPTSKGRLALKLFVPMAFVGFALGIHKHISVQTTLGGGLTPESCIILLLAASLTVSVFVLFARLYPEGNWDTLFRVIVPTISCISLLFAVLVSGDRLLCDLFLLITYIFIETVVWVYYAYIAHKVRLSPIFIFGLSRGIITLFMLLGALTAAWCNPYLEATPLGDMSAMVISLVLIALGYALMPRESDILRSIVECPAVRLVALALDEKLDLLGNQPAPPIAETSFESASEAPDETEAAPTQEEGASNLAAEEAISPTPAHERPAAPVSVARAAIEGAAISPERTGGRFSQKVKKVAAIYLLTERETDILFELAKGGSASYIQEKYYISASTVKTHIRNIYRKLDIHKRTDLLRLLEEIDDYE